MQFPVSPRDKLFNIKFVEAIELNTQKEIDRYNSKENSSRISYNYQVGDKVLITSNDIPRKLHCPTIGPYPIIQVYSNSTDNVQNSAMTSDINNIFTPMESCKYR